MQQNNQQGSSPTLKPKGKLLLPLALVLTIFAFGSLAFASYKTYYSVDIYEHFQTNDGTLITSKPIVIDSIPQFDYDSVQLPDGITAYPDSKVVEVSRGVNLVGQEIDQMLFERGNLSLNLSVTGEVIANYYESQLEDKGWQTQKSARLGCEEGDEPLFCHYIWHLYAQKNVAEINMTIPGNVQYLIEIQNGLPRAIVVKLSEDIQPYLQNEGLELTGLFGVYPDSDHYFQRAQFDLTGDIPTIMDGIYNIKSDIQDGCGSSSSRTYFWGGCLDSIVGPYTYEYYRSASIYPEKTFMFTLKKPY